MDYESLTRSQRRAYEDACSRTHRREVEVLLLTLDGTLVRSLDGFMGGSMQGDDTAAPEAPREVLEVDVFDPAGRLDWSHGRHRKYMLRVIDSRWIEDLGEWVEAVVFTGPLWDFSRDDDAVHLVAHGSELHAQGNVSQVYSVGRKARATVVIRELLTLSGARARDRVIPSLKHRLPERVTVGVEQRLDKRGSTTKYPLGGKKGKKNHLAVAQTVQRFIADREDTYWSAASEIAAAIDRDLFCDQLGRYVVRAPSSRPAISVRPEQLVTPVTETRGEAGEVTNTWHIYGPKPKGKKKRVHVKVALPASHPLSAQGLSRGGRPREVIERVENKHIRTAADARRIGARLRDRAMRELVTYEVQMMPVVPWLRPGSLVSIPTPSGRTNTRVRQWTLPLGPGADPLVLGGNRRRSLGNGSRPGGKRWRLGSRVVGSRLRSKTVGGLRSRWA